MSKKKIILIGLASCVAVTAAATAVFASPGSAKYPQVRTALVQEGELMDSVNVNGTVYSRNVVEVYAPLNYTIETVNVRVGDRVEEGDVLARLDTSDLELDIAQARATVSAQQNTARQTLETAKREMETYETTFQTSYETNLLTAQSAVEQAKLGVQSANSSVWAARKELREAREEGDVTDYELTKLRSQISQLEIDLEKAQALLETREKELETAKNATPDNKPVYEEQIKSAELSTETFNDQYIAIQKKEAYLEDADILAPASGVITAVNAVEGAQANGLLFVIQDTDNLKVIANIKEYDIQRVALGNEVLVKTDATGDRYYSGLLESIAPTSTLSTTGEATDSTDAEFESEIFVQSDGELRIGMNARLQIISQRRDNTLYVPYEAIVEEAMKTLAYVVKLDSEGGYIARAVPVEVGLENDFNSEILSGVTADDVIILEPEGISDGMQVSVAAGMPLPIAPEGSTENNDGGEA